MKCTPHRLNLVILVSVVVFTALACGSGGTDTAPETEAQAPASPPAPAPALSELADATYEGIYDEPITLAGGKWEGEPYEPGSAIRPTAGLVKHFRLTGDLNEDGREEAAVLLWETSGGSGTNLFLAAMARRGKEIEGLGTVLIGNRVQVRAGRVTDGRIELDLVQAGPDDAMCCPSQKATTTWSLGADGLALVKSEVTGTLSLADLGGAEWVLTHLSRDEQVPSGAEITLVIEDGKVTGHGGCNGYFGEVTGQAPGELSFSPFGATQMACPPPVMDLEQRYLAALGGTTSYSFLGGRLVLSGMADDAATTLIFVPRDLAGKTAL